MTAVTGWDLNAGPKLLYILNGHSRLLSVGTRCPPRSRRPTLKKTTTVVFQVPNYPSHSVVPLSVFCAIQRDRIIHGQTSGGESAPQYKKKALYNHGCSAAHQLVSSIRSAKLVTCLRTLKRWNGRHLSNVWPVYDVKLVSASLHSRPRNVIGKGLGENFAFNFGQMSVGDYEECERLSEMWFVQTHRRAEGKPSHVKEFRRTLSESCTQLLYLWRIQREQGLQLTDYIQRRNLASGVVGSGLAVLHR